MECEKHKGQGIVWIGDRNYCYGCYCEQFEHCPLCGRNWDDPLECKKGKAERDELEQMQTLVREKVLQNYADKLDAEITASEKVKNEEAK